MARKRSHLLQTFAALVMLLMSVCAPAVAQKKSGSDSRIATLEKDNAEYESTAESDSMVILKGNSQQKFGSVKASLDKNGRLGSFEYTGEFP